MATNEALNGRWCPDCGGELSIKRRWEPEALVTYLLCVFCGWKQATMRYDRETREYLLLL